MLGVDPNISDYERKLVWTAHDTYGPEVVQVVKKDLETARALYKKKEFFPF